MKTTFVKQLTLAVIALLVSTSVSIAQNGPEQQRKGNMPSPEMHQKMIENMSKELSLSEEQQEKVNAIFSSQHEKMLAKQEGQRSKMEAARAEREAMRKEFISQLVEVLDKDQIVAYILLQEKQGPKPGMRGKRGNDNAPRGRGQGRGERM